MHKILENFFNFLDNYHQNRIIKNLKSLKLQKIIDVGSHKGEFLSYAIKIDNIAQIFAFEPQKEINRLLKEKFGKFDYIKIFDCALDDNISKKYIYINKLTSTSTLSEFNNNSIYLKFKNLILGSKKNFIDKYTVETNTIDNIFKEIELSNSLLKIDVEGFEINVLKGSSKKLKEISYILVENQFGNHYKNNNTVSVYEFLKDNNFKVIKNFYFPTLHFKDVLYKNEKN